MMISLPFAKGLFYLILGYGKSGLACARALEASGARVALWDDNPASREKIQGYELIDPAEADLTGVAGLIVAPAIPLTPPHPAIVKARAAGVEVLGDIDLLFRAEKNATFVGITGTNGKSTTTALIGHILEQAGRKVEVGGNIGQAVLGLRPLGKGGIYVLELSSFQLDLLRGNLLSVAVFLNLTPDHYDRHGGAEGYLKAKEKIIREDAPQTVILGTDEPEMQDLFHRLEGRANLKLKEISVQHRVAHGIYAGERKLVFEDSASKLPPFDLKAIETLPGLHNAQNAAAAFLACRALGLPHHEIEAGLRSFPGLAHRQQSVATLRGVRFVNDSKATNADAASKALASYDEIYWILGGKPKAGGLAGLEPLVSSVRHAYLIGQASDDFATWCAKNNVPATPCGTLDVAVARAAQDAFAAKKPHAVVLLSPACASFDQFSGFEERGEVFERLVHSLEKTPAPKNPAPPSEAS